MAAGDDAASGMDSGATTGRAAPCNRAAFPGCTVVGAALTTAAATPPVRADDVLELVGSTLPLWLESWVDDTPNHTPSALRTPPAANAHGKRRCQLGAGE